MGIRRAHGRVRARTASGTRTGPRAVRSLAAVIAAVATIAATGGMAGAGTGKHGSSNGGSDRGPTTLASGLVGPLHLDVSTGWKGPNVLVSQSFAGTVSRVGKGGVTDVVSSPGAFTGGAVAGPFGTVMYLIGDETGPYLKMRLPNGTDRTIADLGTYEATKNPDQHVLYGVQGASADCLAKVPPEIPGIAPYHGEVNSNPYELVVTPFGTYVADAGGNTILFVEWSGRIRTVSVLPPRPEVITADAAAAAGLPDCMVGLTFNFEAVPTDVEFGPDLHLYVSSLPGGPEDASLGARGGVFRVHPITGKAKLIGTGFLGATNVAVAPNGTVYVAELFGNKVSKLVRGAPVTVAQLTEPAALEWSGGRLYATTDVNTDGKVVSFRP